MPTFVDAFTEGTRDVRDLLDGTSAAADLEVGARGGAPASARVVRPAGGEDVPSSLVRGPVARPGAGRPALDQPTPGS